MRKFTLSLIMASLIPLVSGAQRYLGVATSNWSGLHGMYLNPANIADSRHKLVVDLVGVNVGINNNSASIKQANLSEFFRDEEKRDIGNLFTFDNKEKFSLVIPAELRLPGIMYSINRKHSVGLSMRVRAMFQVHNFNQTLFKNIVDNFNPNNNITLQASDFNYTYNQWSEIGGSYGGVIWENDKHQIKGGATLRYLMGNQYMSITTPNLNLQYNPTAQTLTAINSQINIGTNMLSDDNSFNFEVSGNNGKGFGGDVGFVYEFRPKAEKYKYDMDGKTGIMDNGANKYLIRASVSVTDIGSIKYSGANNKTGNFKGNGVLKGQEIADTVRSFEGLKNYFVSKGFSADTNNNASTKVQLPTALIAGVDVNIYKGFYANLTLIQNMVSRSSFGNSYYTQIAVTPRFDTRVFSLGLPITYNSLSSNVSIGAGLRVGGFYVGGDDLFGNSYGKNFYFGAYVPINKKKPRDSDGDLVSNRKDKCRNEKGVWEMQGCPNPDTDGDGVVDRDDKCPELPGSKTAMGCPDADLDSVADAEDRCPQDAGLVAMQGCPDRDNDGVADIDDACPDVAGAAQFNGCPDTDGDGVADNLDKCPTQAGPVVNEGCPDTDSDGVADNVDKCPTVAGTQGNFGCPEVSVEVKKRLAFAATAIQFETGKAVIKKASFKLLDEIVKILNDYPDYIMTIDGHTDNVGSDQVNMKMSIDRANAVKDYFVKKGISSDRLIANGYGETQPVASNKTAAGRAKNRRVAMDLKLKN
jgi:outer membrane protein OmpA-like peptidoglycan-associated protein